MAAHREGEKTFSSNQAVLGVIERIVAPIGRRIDESSPLVDARLEDGSRVNAIIPPLALKGPKLATQTELVTTKEALRRMVAYLLAHLWNGVEPGAHRRAGGDERPGGAQGTPVPPR